MTIRKSAAAWVMATLFPGAGIGSAAEPAPSGLVLPVISIEAFPEAGADPRLILIDLRDQAGGGNDHGGGGTISGLWLRSAPARG